MSYKKQRTVFTSGKKNENAERGLDGLIICCLFTGKIKEGSRNETKKIGVSNHTLF